MTPRGLRTQRQAAAVLLLAALLGAPGAWAGSGSGSGGAEPPAGDPPAPPPPAEDTAEEEAPPSLDDLLGLEKDDADRRAEDAARRDAREALDRELAEKRITDSMQLALEKMTLSADLLDRLDAGLGTQRVQEEILARLDELIDQARSLQSMSRKPKPGQGEPCSQPQQAPGQRPQSGGQAQRPPQATESTAIEPPPPQEGDINKILDESRSEWGHLPERIREKLRQGLQGRSSKHYEELTAEYYKRLAEDE